MKPDILIILPTRGRTASALEAVGSVLKTCAKPELLHIVICVDDDDPARFSLSSNNIETIVAPRKRFIATMNDATARFVADYKWISWGADDIRFLTTGWDDIVRSHKELVVYGPDGIQNEKMATHPWIQTVIPLALGYLLPKELVHLCADTFIETLAREIDSIAYNPSLKIEHLHFWKGKSVEDETYKDAQVYWETDKATFDKVIKPTMPFLAHVVRKYMNDRP